MTQTLKAPGLEISTSLIILEVYDVGTYDGLISLVYRHRHDKWAKILLRLVLAD